MTIESGIRCFHCKTDVFPAKGQETRCSCGRVRYAPDGQANAAVGTRIRRIVSAKEPVA